LPTCLAPRRQYWWSTQQAVLEELISGRSVRAVARRMWPSCRTIARWRRWLQGRFDEHALHLRSRFAELGRALDWNRVWSRCFELMSLAEAMGRLDRMGVSVP
jgi:hypothetical protein